MKIGVHLARLTWNLRINPWKRRNIFQTIIFRFYVNLGGCIPKWMVWKTLLKWMIWGYHPIFGNTHIGDYTTQFCAGSQRIHVWYIYLHLVDFYGECRWIYINIPYMDPLGSLSLDNAGSQFCWYLKPSRWWPSATSQVVRWSSAGRESWFPGGGFNDVSSSTFMRGNPLKGI